MNTLLEFLARHYILWIVISTFLIFALIGYFVRNNKSDNDFKINDNTPDIDFSNIANNVSINDALNKNSSTDKTESL